MNLYKYTKYYPEMISDQLFRFNTVAQLNDPFEGSIDYSSLTDIISGLGLKKPKIAGQMLRHTNRMIDIKHLGAFCLSENFDNILMWSHYANNHDGIVVCFDSDNAFFHSITDRTQIDNINTIHIGNLKRIHYKKSKIKAYENPFIEPIFIKSFDWIYEQEWRLLLPLDEKRTTKRNNNGDIFLFQIPSKAILKIIIGHRFDEKILLKDLQTYTNINPALDEIEIIKAELDPNAYRLNFKCIKKTYAA